jgi:hypothetical protein
MNPLHFELWLSHPPIKFNMAKLRNCQRWERLHEQKKCHRMPWSSFGSMAKQLWTALRVAKCQSPGPSTAWRWLFALFFGAPLVLSLQYCYPEMTMVETVRKNWFSRFYLKFWDHSGSLGNHEHIKVNFTANGWTWELSPNFRVCNYVRPNLIDETKDTTGVLWVTWTSPDLWTCHWFRP